MRPGSKASSTASGRNRGKQSGRRRTATRRHAHQSRGKPHAKPRNGAGSNSGCLILLNKPFGVVSQFSGDDNNLSQLVPIDNVYPAGRLDKDSEGLLLLTDHGPLQHHIAHPSQKLRKTYLVQVEGTITDEALKRLQHGVQLKDGLATALQATPITPPRYLWPRTPPIRSRQSIPTDWLELVIDEGRNRQVRRMTAAVGLPTLRLIRTSIGRWSVAPIDCGEYQTLQFNSIDEILE
jgi:23S rRNA pseudouridine2457 synthase